MGIAYRKFEPTEYVMKVRRGKVVQKGLGLSFFYNTMTTSMIVIPATAFDTGFAFDELMTADFQSGRPEWWIFPGRERRNTWRC